MRILVTMVIIFLMVLVFTVSTLIIAGDTHELDVWGRIIRVVDGDTVYVKIYKAYKSKYNYLVDSTVKVRFADINAPELGTHEGETAKRALERLVDYGYVYLDIDDRYVYDKYGRVVAVVYLPLNKTVAVNVNLWLVVNGYARVTDYPNEFNPHQWQLYIPLPSGTKTTTTKTITTRVEAVTYTTTVYKYLTVTKTTTKTKPYTTTEAKVITKTLTYTTTRIIEKTEIISEEYGELYPLLVITGMLMLIVGFILGWYITRKAK